MSETKTNWCEATTNLMEAIAKLMACIQSERNAWIEVRPNGNQKFPIKKKNPELDNPFNWKQNFATIRDTSFDKKKSYFNDTEKDLVENWTGCLGTEEAVKQYQENRTVSKDLFTGSTHCPVRIEDVKEYRESIGKPYNYRYFESHWIPKDGIDYYVIDDSIKNVYTICYSDGPLNETQAIQKTIQCLSEYSASLSGHTGMDIENVAKETCLDIHEIENYVTENRYNSDMANALSEIQPFHGNRDMLTLMEELAELSTEILKAASTHNYKVVDIAEETADVTEAIYITRMVTGTKQCSEEEMIASISGGTTFSDSRTIRKAINGSITDKAIVLNDTAKAVSKYLRQKISKAELAAQFAVAEAILYCIREQFGINRKAISRWIDKKMKRMKERLEKEGLS